MFWTQYFDTHVTQQDQEWALQYFNFAKSDLSRPDYTGKLYLLLEAVFFRIFDQSEGFKLLRALLNDLLELTGAEQLTELVRQQTVHRANQVGDKEPVFDFLATDAKGRQLHLELQLLPQPFYLSRAVYYMSRVHGMQLVKGEDYGRLAPTVSLHILGHTLFKPVEDWPEHTRQVKLCETLRGRPVTDDLVGVFVELPKLPAKREGLATPAEKWLYFLKHGHSLDQREVHAMGMELLEEADEKLRDVSRSNDLRYVGLTEAIRRMDEVTTRNYFTQQGYLQGVSAGHTQGLSQGLARGLRRMLVNQFGPLPIAVNAAIDKIESPEQLETLMDRAATARSLDALGLELEES